MQLSKWGNSLAVRIPASVIEMLNLKEGDDIEIVIADAKTFGIRKSRDAADFIARVQQFRGMLPPDFKFDREEANGL